VRGSIVQDSTRPEGISGPSPGCPLTYTERDKRMILRNLRLYPKSTFDERQKEYSLDISSSTIKRFSRNHALYHWRSKKQPELTEEHAAARLLWCKCRAHWGVEEWKIYMWSDECSAERLNGCLDYGKINGSHRMSRHTGKERTYVSWSRQRFGAWG
jgi:hypothetical protein